MEALKDKLETLHNFRKLVASAEWGELVKILDGQIEVRETVIRQPLKGHDQIFEQEFQKGEAAGIRLVQRLPGQLIQTLEYEVELLKSKEKQDES